MIDVNNNRYTKLFQDNPETALYSLLLNNDVEIEDFNSEEGFAFVRVSNIEVVNDYFLDARIYLHFNEFGENILSLTLELNCEEIGDYLLSSFPISFTIREAFLMKKINLSYIENKLAYSA